MLLTVFVHCASVFRDTLFCYTYPSFVSNVFVAAMVSVEDVSARLREFMRIQQIANEGFAPNAERQDFINTGLREANIELSQRVDVLEARTAKLEEDDVERVGAELPEIKGLQDQVGIPEAPCA